ncbi:serine/threonine-protein kinase [Cellulomonas sp. CW35]|uniref:serine/threonine-protein kinase n=1 Tax=Cellulomonas sp. CW35 TaxID=3458249 RepID=UPI004033826D
MERIGLAPGAQIGGYTVVAPLGSGGMGTVYRAVDDGGTAVALKLLHPQIGADAQGRDRLRREVLALQRLRHRSVASVLDAEADSTEAFIVTELVAGANLEDHVREHGPFGPDDLRDLARDLTDALTAVHTAGVVHRDLKPTNVVVGEDGPVLIDFGIAQAAGDRSAQVTTAGLVVGTPGYLAPELLDGAEPSPETDLWGLAAVLAFAATGRPPFGTRPLQTVLARARAGDADLTGLGPLTSDALRRALDPDPAARLDADDLVAALAVAAVDGDPVETGPGGAVVEDAAVAATVALGSAGAGAPADDEDGDAPDEPAPDESDADDDVPADPDDTHPDDEGRDDQPAPQASAANEADPADEESDGDAVADDENAVAADDGVDDRDGDEHDVDEDADEADTDEEDEGEDDDSSDDDERDATSTVALTATALADAGPANPGKEPGTVVIDTRSLPVQDGHTRVLPAGDPTTVLPAGPSATSAGPAADDRAGATSGNTLDRSVRDGSERDATVFENPDLDELDDLALDPRYGQHLADDGFDRGGPQAWQSRDGEADGEAQEGVDWIEDDLDASEVVPDGSGYERPPARRRWGSLLALAALVGALGALAPVVTVGVLVVLLVLVRTAGTAVEAMYGRREQRGVRASDVPRTVVATPWYLVRAVVALVPSLVVASCVTVLVGGVVAWLVDNGTWTIGDLRSGDPVDGGTAALVVASAVLLWLVVAWWGPLSRMTRTGARRVLAVVAPGRLGAAVLVVACVLAAVVVASLVSNGAGIVWSPAPTPTVP